MNKIGRYPPRYLPKTIFEVSKDQTFRLKLKHPNEGLVLLRYLCTKFYARGETLLKDEEIIWYLVLEYFRELRNVTLGAQYFSSTELQSLFALSRHYATFRSSEYPRWALAQIAILKRNAGLLSPRAFLGMQKQFEVECFVKRDNRNLRPEPQPLRRIGVGYRDKGTAAIPHQDGTPRWQEVAGKAIAECPIKEHYGKIWTRCFFEALTPYQTKPAAYLG
jgi:hypothetical protein